MTMERNTKAEVQIAATSTEPVRTASPKARAAYGRYFPLELGRKMAVTFVRPTRTHGRDRDMVIRDKVKARRRAGRVRVA